MKTFFFALLVLSCLLSGVVHAASADAQGGRIYGINLVAVADSNNWMGLYGSINSSGTTSYTNSSGSVQEINIQVPSCDMLAAYLFASISNSVNWAALTGATPGEVDAYINVSANVTDSGTNTFNSTKNYSFDSISISNVNTTYTLSANASQLFDLGALKDGASGKLVFVTTAKLGGGISFANTSANYQMMLPIKAGQANETYYFYSMTTCVPTPTPPPVYGGFGGFGGRGNATPSTTPSPTPRPTPAITPGPGSISTPTPTPTARPTLTPTPFVPVEVTVTLDELLRQLLNLFPLLLLLLLILFFFIKRRKKKRREAEEKRGIARRVRRELLR